MKLHRHLSRAGYLSFDGFLLILIPLSADDPSCVVIAVAPGYARTLLHPSFPLFPPDISLISCAHIGRTIDRYRVSRAFCLYSYKRYTYSILVFVGFSVVVTQCATSKSYLRQTISLSSVLRCLLVPDSEAGPPARLAPHRVRF